MKLNNILTHKGLTMQQLSEQTGISYHTLQKYSSGVRNFSVKNAKILGKVLEVNWWEFFEDEEEQEENR